MKVDSDKQMASILGAKRDLSALYNIEERYYLRDVT